MINWKVDEAQTCATKDFKFLNLVEAWVNDPGRSNCRKDKSSY